MEVIEAKGLQDMRSLSTMSPYAVVEVANCDLEPKEKFTPVADYAGTEPKFNTTFKWEGRGALRQG